VYVCVLCVCIICVYVCMCNTVQHVLSEFSHVEVVVVTSLCSRAILTLIVVWCVGMLVLYEHVDVCVWCVRVCVVCVRASGVVCVRADVVCVLFQLCVCVCVCVCDAWWRDEERGRREDWTLRSLAWMIERSEHMDIYTYFSEAIIY